MNIKEAERLTGITKQNIRFYERKGLLRPQRNQENSYREYTKEDIERLLQIKIWRKLDLSLENIHRLLEGEPREAVLEEHLNLLLEKQSDLNASIKMCQFLIHAKEASIDTEALLLKMERMERKGGRFMNILHDYRKVRDAEGKRQFSFTPDSMVSTPAEFTEALCKYGIENGLNLVVTKEGMYPKFEIDGLEYEAHRSFGRFGAVVSCKVTDPKLLEKEYEEVLPNRSSAYRKIHRGIALLAVPTCFFLYFAISRKSILAACLLSLFLLPQIWFYFRNFRIK